MKKREENADIGSDAKKLLVGVVVFFACVIFTYNYYEIVYSSVAYKMAYFWEMRQIQDVPSKAYVKSIKLKVSLDRGMSPFYPMFNVYLKKNVPQSDEALEEILMEFTNSIDTVFPDRTAKKILPISMYGVEICLYLHGDDRCVLSAKRIYDDPDPNDPAKPREFHWAVEKVEW